MSEGENHQEDELWEEVPEPEEITEEEARKLPIDVFAEDEGEPDEQPAGVTSLGGPPKRRPDRFINLRGAPFGRKNSSTPTFECPCFSSRTIFVPSATLNALVRRLVFVAS